MALKNKTIQRYSTKLKQMLSAPLLGVGKKKHYNSRQSLALSRTLEVGMISSLFALHLIIWFCCIAFHTKDCRQAASQNGVRGYNLSIATGSWVKCLAHLFHRRLWLNGVCSRQWQLKTHKDLSALFPNKLKLKRCSKSAKDICVLYELLFLE